MSKKRNVLKAVRIAAAVLLIGYVVLEALKIRLVQDAVHNSILTVLLTRSLASIFFLTIFLEGENKVPSRKPVKEYLSSLPFAVPALLVAVNNLPIIGLITGLCRVSDSPLWVFLFALECAAVGTFEELAFRGVLFPYFLRKCKSRLHIFICIVATSAVFGLYHLFNLLEGAGFGDVALQIGYSTLIGAMCAACMLITGDILVPIIIHAVYNFCGLLIPTIGEGKLWDTPTVILTAILGTAVFVFYFVVFFRKKSFRLFEMIKAEEPQDEAPEGDGQDSRRRPTA